MIRALTGYATRHPWKVIALWAVLGIVLSALVPTLMSRVTQHSTGDFLPRTYDSAAALHLAREKFGEDPDATLVTVLVAREDGKPLASADRKRIEQGAKELSGRRVVMPVEDDMPRFLVPDRSQTPAVAPATTAPDGRFALLSVRLTGSPSDTGVQGVYRTFRDDARGHFAEAGLRTGFTGGLAELVDTTDDHETATTVGGILVTVLIILLNVLAFRSVLAAVLPLLAVALIGGVAAGAVVGAALLSGRKLDAGTPGLINVVLLGIGIDYLLFLLFRYREHLRERPTQDAREAAAQVSGRVGTAITSAALTIVAAFATLGLATFGQFRSMGPAIAVAVLVMLLGSLTLMPALLAAAGRKMFWPSKALKRTPVAGRAARFGELVTGRPLLMLAASAALLAALSAGLIGIRMDYGRDASGSTTRAAATAAEISRTLPAGVSDPTSVYVTADDGSTLAPARLHGLARALAEVDGVGKTAPTVLSQDRRAARIDLYPTADPQSQQARDLVSGPIREAAARHTPAGTTAVVGGTAAVFADVATAVGHDLRIVFPVAAALITLILLLLLRSLLAPVVLMLAVGAGFAATLGAAALLFQRALGEPGVDFTLPLVLFLFVVALGTDYNILIADRIREEMRRPTTARTAVARALRHTTPAVATAGLVLAGSFATLAATPGSAQIAFAMTLGILLSALVLALVVVPALAALLGRALWWPLRPAPVQDGRARHRTTEAEPVHPGSGVYGKGEATVSR
ncbi:putative membrane protein ActII-3 [Streptomyces spiroverticillatus]|uniref:Membrane protein ActII-3 n=1 Tax=Streptomyces finlayi TaxID=67296 RepID=A0A919CB94_9ACTN|nr:MMPL family transporter [Streptomyces finlayi]GHA16639.1 putative membrane protein ActII-3 [Streptomyces spiroverticillatus]GHC98798.1 putative membrane protein ActII-3 [Streptomyces finlayi]